jgi:hypothetical protein
MAGVEVTLFYVPFHYETYAPVTIESIEKKAHCVLRVSSSEKEMMVLLRLLGDAPKGRFDGKVVRLKAVGLDPSPIFVDRSGGVLKEQSEEFSLSREAFGELKALLDALAKSRGCEI